ncbi:MAG: ABC transporter permease, partial [Deltaproteobacteria bacterium]
MMWVVIAWRNIWRNVRRTLVILAAVVVGVWSMVSLGALMRGVADRIVENGIATLTGHIQIHAPGYREDPSVENSMDNPGEVEEVLRSVLPPGSLWTVRVRVPAVVSNARNSRGITLVGVVPGREEKVSFLGVAVKEGEFLRPGDPNGAVAGGDLVKLFGTKVGRKLVVTAQDANGDIASRAFRIRGIFRADMAATEREFLFVPLDSARKLLKMGEKVSEFAVLLPDHSAAREVAERIRRRLPEGKYEVSPWQDLLPLT